MLIIKYFRLKAHRNLFPGGVCKIKCKADIAGGVWATSQSQVQRGNIKMSQEISFSYSVQVLSVGDLSSNPVEYLDVYSSTSNTASTKVYIAFFLSIPYLLCVISMFKLYYYC